jgi:fucose permease
MLVFALSSAILPAALLRAAGELHVDVATLTRVVATQFGAFFLSTLIGGMLSDRYGKPVVLQVGCLLTAAGALVWVGARQMAAAHVAALLLGMGGGILESIGSALLADLYPERRKFALNVTQVAYCAGAAVGPAIMSILLPQGVSWRMFFAGEAVLGLMLLALYRATPAPRTVLLETSGWRELVQPLRSPSVRLLALALFGYVLAESGLGIGAAVYLQVQHHAPERWAILGITLIWVGMLVGRMICAALPETLSTERLVAGLATAGAVVLAAQGAVTDWRVSFVLFGLAGLIFSGIWPLIVALCVSRQPQRSGAAVGLVIAAGALGVIAAPMIMAALLQRGQARLIFPLYALALLITAVAVRLPRAQTRHNS